jgi:signal transduction histidine kinase
VSRIVRGLRLAALAVLLASWMPAAGGAQDVSREAWIEEARQGYAKLWSGLREEAAAGAEAVGKPPEKPGERLAAFTRLDGVEVDRAAGRRALLLIDPDGVPTAWAGEGLLHEVPEDVPRSGLHYRAGFSAVTLLAVHPLDESRRPWRIVAGASFSTDTLPFPIALHGSTHWSLIEASAPSRAARGAILIRVPGAPTLVVEPDAVAEPVQGRPWPIPLFAVGVLAAGLALAALGLSRRFRDGGRLPATVKGTGAVLLLFAASWAIHRVWGPLDINAGILTSPASFALRLGLSAAALGILCLAGSRKGPPPDAPPTPRDRWAWAAVLLLLAGAALCDFPLPALLLLGLGGAAAAEYADQRRLGEGLALLALILMSVLAAAGAWETAYRLRLRQYAGTELLGRLSPPTPREVAAVNQQVRAYFRELDLVDLVPRAPEGLERQDVAFALWRGSPLARSNALSALVVLRPGVPPSSFSFGMPLVEPEGGEPLLIPTPWQNFDLPLWEGTLVSGWVDIRFAGKPWGRARYWLLPRPGFDVRRWNRLGEVEVGLLRGAPAEVPVEGLAAPALYALYGADRRAVLSPWEEEPPLPAALRKQGGAAPRRTVVDTPSGRASAWARSAPGGWEVLFLPYLQPLEALERGGHFAVGTLLLLALAAPPVLLLALPRAGFRDALSRTWRSYSKRLMIVYTVLLLAPLVLLNLVLVRAMEERLSREQRAAGEEALAASQQILGDRLLNLPLGFGVDRAFGDRMLVELATVARHDVNLYWGSGIHASSRHELFTAGLLPKRIPGEIYRRLALLGYGLSSRTNRVGGTTYLEMYAPLRVPGVEMGQERLFVLSVPLLAQQEEAGRQLAQLRRHGFLVTAALVTLLIAVGRRLARNFTRPLMQLVEGTRRIAGGATSLDLAPTELELAALVEAVDEMARRIAEGRERLVREKQVVERMVENITSGIVSLDRERRVLLHNRVASELLGTEVGESLEQAVERSERLAPVAAFLRTSGGEMARGTVRLRGEESGEREWSLVWVPLPGSGEPSALLVVEDATEVLRGQRLLAWAEMARMIAHEIKNPLTPIRLSAEHMREVYRNDPSHFDRVFERCTTNILTQVDELRSIASEFSAYSSIPRIDPKPADLVASMADLVEGYRAAPPEGVRVDFEAEPETIPARFDAKLLNRAVRNLIENALRASAGGGRVLVRVDQVDHTAHISVADAGPGVQPDLLPRIFDPYFSTHDTGTGLGLPIARRIAEEHGGDITAKNRPEGGLEVVVTLPV